ncbi:MAG: 2-oxo acid dehydrogenase subunit E2 [Chloroflexi bacterium]|nr:2-oxo acid dehydrogenase subunit E2 [Chloroflexota bacterium]
MPVPFIMPKFDMDQEKATIISWEKHEGDTVRMDETVLTVETDKVSMEVPCPADGVLAGIKYQNGDTVPVTTVIAYVLKPGETVADLPRDKIPASAPKPEVAPPPLAEVSAAAVASVAATPVAVRMAKEEGVDLAKVQASGNRITREDVEHYLVEKVKPAGRVAVAATPAARRVARERDIPLEAVAGSGPRGRVQAADVAAFQSPHQPIFVSGDARPADVVPLIGIRQRIAERMQSSFQELPHIALTIEVDVTELEAARRRLNELAMKQSHGKVSMTALLVKITAWALKRNPYVNSSLVGDQIHLWRDVNIGIATALDEGLIVPVIRQANEKSIRQIVDALDNLTSRARDGKLTLADVQQGTFTISNLGMFGIRQFRAIINPPESAILAVGTMIRKPVVINERDEVAVRPSMTLTLSADHRVIDGVVAARFLNDLMLAIETPETLLY